MKENLIYCIKDIYVPLTQIQNSNKPMTLYLAFPTSQNSAHRRTKTPLDIHKSGYFYFVQTPSLLTE